MITISPIERKDMDARTAWESLTWGERFARVIEWGHVADGYNGGTCPVLIAECAGKRWNISRWGYFPAF